MSSIKGFYETVSDVVSTKSSVRLKALESIKSRTIEWPDHVDDYIRLISALLDSAKQGATGIVSASTTSVLVSTLGCLLTVLTEFQNSTTDINAIDKRERLATEISPLCQKIVSGLIFLLTDNSAVQTVVKDPGAIEYIAKIIRLITSADCGGLLLISRKLFTSSIAAFLVISLMKLPSSSSSLRRDELTRSAAICVIDNFGGNYSKTDAINLLNLSVELFSQSSKIPEMLFNINLVTNIIISCPLIFREIINENFENIKLIFNFIFDFLIPGHLLEKPAINLIRLVLFIGRNIAAEFLLESSPQLVEKVLEIYADSNDLMISDILANLLILKNENTESKALDYILSTLEYSPDLSPIHHASFAKFVALSTDHRWRTDPFFVEKFSLVSSTKSPDVLVTILEKFAAPSTVITDSMRAMWTRNIPTIVNYEVSINSIKTVIFCRKIMKRLTNELMEIPSLWTDQIASSLTSDTDLSESVLAFSLITKMTFSDSQLSFLFSNLTSSQIAIFSIRQVMLDEPIETVGDVIDHFVSKCLSPKNLDFANDIESTIITLRHALCFQTERTSVHYTATSPVSGTKIRTVVKAGMKFCGTKAELFSMNLKPSQQIIDTVANLTLAHLILGNLFSSIRCDPCILTSILAVCSQGIVSRSVTNLKMFISKELPVIGDMITLCTCPKHVDKLGEPRSLLSQQPVTIDTVDIFEEKTSRRGSSQTATRKDLVDPEICSTRAGWVSAVKSRIQTLETSKWNARDLLQLTRYVVQMDSELDSVNKVLELIAFKPEVITNYVNVVEFGKIIVERRENFSDILFQEFLGSRVIGDTEESAGYISLVLSPLIIPLLITHYQGVSEDISSTLLPPTIGSVALLLSTSIQTQSVDLFLKSIRVATSVSPFSIPHMITVVRESFSSVFGLRNFFANFFIKFSEDDELLEYIVSLLDPSFGLEHVLVCIQSLSARPVADRSSLGAVTAKLLTDFSPHKPIIPPEISPIDVALLGIEMMELFGSTKQLRDPFRVLQQLGLKLTDRPWLAKYVEFRKTRNSFSNSACSNEVKKQRVAQQGSPLTFVPASTRTSAASIADISQSFFLASLIANTDFVSDSNVPAMYAFMTDSVSAHSVGEILSHLCDDGRGFDSLKPINNTMPKISYIPLTDSIAYPADYLCEMVFEIYKTVCPVHPATTSWIYSRIENANLLLPFLFLRSTLETPIIINKFLLRKIPSITIALADAICSLSRRIEFVYTGTTIPSPQSVLTDLLLHLDLAVLGSNLIACSRPIDAYFVAELMARLFGDIVDSPRDSLLGLLGTPPKFLQILLESLNMIGTTKISSFSSSLHPSLRPILSRLRGDTVALLHEDSESDRLWASEALGLCETRATDLTMESISTWNSQMFMDTSSLSQITTPDSSNLLKEKLIAIRCSVSSYSPRQLFELESALNEPFPPSAIDTVDECWVLYVGILRRGGFFHRGRKIAEKIVSARFCATTQPSTVLKMYSNLSKIYWQLQMVSEATKLITAVCTSPESPATRLDDVRVVRIVPRLLSQAGEWLGEQRLEPLSEIRKKYFARAIQVLPESDLKSIVKVKIRLVKVIDPELIETKTPQKNLISEEVNLLCEILTCGILPVMKAAWFSSRLLSLWFAFPGVASLAFSKHRSTLAASQYMLPFFYQIAGQIGSLSGDENVPNEFKKELVAFIVESGKHHPFICLPPLLQLRSSSMSGPSASPKTCSVQNAKLDSDRGKNAEKIIEKIKASSKNHVESMEAGFRFYLNLALAKPALGSAVVGSSTRSSQVGPKRLVSDIVGYTEYAKAIAAGNCPILTCSSEINIKSIVPEYMIADSGKSLPKIVKVIDGNGRVHRQIVKGNDDLRNDAVLQQLFSLIDALCSSGRLRSYKVVPISACAGIAEWVDGTVTLGGYLVGYPNESTGAHCRYRPNDMTPNDIKSAMVSVRQQSKGSVDHIRSSYESLTRKFQPCMNFFFYENFPTASDWYKAQSAFTSSVAATSIVGFIVGLGDRHPNNILIDIATGEVVHIDYGICFDAGRQLKIPEIVPFRLTRDMVDGLGCLGTQGPFSKICQDVLVSLKTNATIVTAVVEVFVVDPLFNWAVAALGSDNAQVALQSVKRKLQGFLEASDVLPLAPPAQVDRLVRFAIDPRNLALMFAGWQPWL